MSTNEYWGREMLYQRWADQLDWGDPFYNPNLTSSREDTSLELDAVPRWPASLDSR